MVLLCSFESRRSEEMKSLIERHGGEAFIAPSMQEIPIDQNATALQAIQQLVDGHISHLILLTGVGTEAMLNVADSAGLRQNAIEAMAKIPLLVRGPKPAAVLKGLNLEYAVKAPQPNTWRELITAIDAAQIDMQGCQVAIQEYGVSNDDLVTALKNRGATVVSIPVYRWALPDDIKPLQQAINGTIDGQFKALLFTSAQQARHVLQVADDMGLRDQWLKATRDLTVASIGPTCSETLEAEGLNIDIEASPPKMGPMVRAVLQRVLT